MSHEEVTNSDQSSVACATAYVAQHEDLSRHELAQFNAVEPYQDQSNLSAHSLAFILHPSHEACTLEVESGLCAFEETISPEEPLSISKTCYALSITSKELRRLSVPADFVPNKIPTADTISGLMSTSET